MPSRERAKSRAAALPIRVTAARGDDRHRGSPAVDSAGGRIIRVIERPWVLAAASKGIAYLEADDAPAKIAVSI
jgi:hypothetical protein